MSQTQNETGNEKNTLDPVELKEALVERYNENELRELCFDLRISYDDLSGDNRRTKIVSLIEYCDRRESLEELAQKVQLVLAPPEPAPETTIEKETIPDIKPRPKYHWFILGGIGVFVVIGVLYLIYSWLNRPPVFTMPPPDLPKTSLILSSDFIDCPSTVNYLPPIDKNLDELAQAFDRTVEVKPVNDLETAVAQSEILETLVIIAGKCISQTSQTVTVTLMADPAYAYALLQEPSEITITTHPDHISAIVNATALYAVGQYEAAQHSLQDTMAALPQIMQDDQSATIYWLWGNILAHLGQSEEAIEAYKEAQTVSGEQNTMDQADLLANISLMTYFASRQQKEKFLGLCRQLGTDRIESALEIAPERADLHVIQGLIFLDCPRSD
ncbi:MAG: hypothetical protein IAF02_22880, partial [Anaerolineae bacterium]|nr:hypothetical protein [Anaerolineae bacterium]